ECNGSAAGAMPSQDARQPKAPGRRVEGVEAAAIALSGGHGQGAAIRAPGAHAGIPPGERGRNQHRPRLEVAKLEEGEPVGRTNGPGGFRGVKGGDGVFRDASRSQAIAALPAVRGINFEGTVAVAECEQLTVRPEVVVRSART